MYVLVETLLVAPHLDNIVAVTVELAQLGRVNLEHDDGVVVGRRTVLAKARLTLAGSVASRFRHLVGILRVREHLVDLEQLFSVNLHAQLVKVLTAVLRQMTLLEELLAQILREVWLGIIRPL